MGINHIAPYRTFVTHPQNQLFYGHFDFSDKLLEGEKFKK